MAWGGSLNKKGSDYIRMIRDADNVIKFLENFKEYLAENQKKVLMKTIDIIIDYINKSFQLEKE